MCAQMYTKKCDHIRDYIKMCLCVHTHEPGHPDQYPG